MANIDKIMDYLYHHPESSSLDISRALKLPDPKCVSYSCLYLKRRKLLTRTEVRLEDGRKNYYTHELTSRAYNDITTHGRWINVKIHKARERLAELEKSATQ